MPKKKPELEKQPAYDEIENINSLELPSESLEKKLSEEMSAEAFKRLKKIAYYLSKVGLSLKESCQLSDVDHALFEKDMEFNPLIRKVIEFKQLEFKKDLMYTLAQRARSGDDKIALAILENKYPDEFGKNKDPGTEGEDIIYEAIQYIRKSGDTHDPMVHGRAVVVRKGGVTEGDTFASLYEKDEVIPTEYDSRNNVARTIEIMGK